VRLNSGLLHRTWEW